MFGAYAILRHLERSFPNSRATASVVRALFSSYRSTEGVEQETNEEQVSRSVGACSNLSNSRALRNSRLISGNCVTDEAGFDLDIGNVESPKQSSFPITLAIMKPKSFRTITDGIYGLRKRITMPSPIWMSWFAKRVARSSRFTSRMPKMELSRLLRL